MVTLAAPARVWSIYATSLVDTMVHSFDGLKEFEVLLADRRRNVIAIGLAQVLVRRPGSLFLRARDQARSSARR